MLYYIYILYMKASGVLTQIYVSTGKRKHGDFVPVQESERLLLRQQPRPFLPKGWATSNFHSF